MTNLDVGVVFSDIFGFPITDFPSFVNAVERSTIQLVTDVAISRPCLRDGFQGIFS